MARTSKKKQAEAATVKKLLKTSSVGIYARLSVDSGDRKNESVETQIEIAKAFYIEKIFPFMGVRFIAVTDKFDSMNVSGQNETLGINLKTLHRIEVYPDHRIKMVFAFKREDVFLNGRGNI